MAGKSPRKSTTFERPRRFSLIYSSDSSLSEVSDNEQVDSSSDDSTDSSSDDDVDFVKLTAERRKAALEALRSQVSTSAIDSEPDSEPESEPDLMSFTFKNDGMEFEEDIGEEIDAKDAQDEEMEEEEEEEEEEEDFEQDLEDEDLGEEIDVESGAEEADHTVNFDTLNVPDFDSESDDFDQDLFLQTIDDRVESEEDADKAEEEQLILDFAHTPSVNETDEYYDSDEFYDELFLDDNKPLEVTLEEDTLDEAMVLKLVAEPTSDEEEFFVASPAEEIDIYLHDDESTDEDENIPPPSSRNKKIGSKAKEVVAADIVGLKPPKLGTWSTNSSKPFDIIDGLSTRSLYPIVKERTVSPDQPQPAVEELTLDELLNMSELDDNEEEVYLNEDTESPWYKKIPSLSAFRNKGQVYQHDMGQVTKRYPMQHTYVKKGKKKREKMRRRASIAEAAAENLKLTKNGLFSEGALADLEEIMGSDYNQIFT